LILKSNEIYPKNQLEKIREILNKLKQDSLEKDNLLAKKLQMQKRYDKIIASADKYFNKEKYKLAIQEYNNALLEMPKEEYPRSRILLITDILAKRSLDEKLRNETLVAKEALDNKYKLLIKKSDISFRLKQYENALITYTEASGLKSEEVYPKQQIKKIELLLYALKKDNAEKDKLLADRKLLESKYKSLILKADELFVSNEYKKAKEIYNLALEIKPSDTYAKDKISEIDSILSKKMKDEQEKIDNEAEYQAYILKANNNFGSKEYKISKFYYNKALDIKPKDEYSEKRIKEINDILKSLEKDNLIVIARSKLVDKSVEKDYQECISKADKAFNTGKLDVASFYYRKAVGLKNEEYPKAQMFKINELWKSGKYAKIRKEYLAWIKKGDNEMKSKKYVLARFNYNKALQIYGAEEYPKNKIIEISKLLDNLKREKLMLEYNKFISQGDTSLDNGQISLARFYYSKALKLMPKEKLAIDKLSKIK